MGAVAPRGPSRTWSPPAVPTSLSGCRWNAQASREGRLPEVPSRLCWCPHESLGGPGCAPATGTWFSGRTLGGPSVLRVGSRTSHHFSWPRTVRELGGPHPPHGGFPRGPAGRQKLREGRVLSTCLRSQLLPGRRLPQAWGFGRSPTSMRCGTGFLHVWPRCAWGGSPWGLTAPDPEPPASAATPRAASALMPLALTSTQPWLVGGAGGARAAGFLEEVALELAHLVPR